MSCFELRKLIILVRLGGDISKKIFSVAEEKIPLNAELEIRIRFETMSSGISARSVKLSKSENIVLNLWLFFTL